MWKGTLFVTGLETTSWKEALHATSPGPEARREAHAGAEETRRKEQSQKRSNKWQKGNCHALTQTSYAAYHLTKGTKHNVQCKEVEGR